MDFSKRIIEQAQIQGKTVLARVDYNVPLEHDGKIANDLRIQASLPTLQYLLAQGAKKVVIISHLGRPNGEKNLAFSLKPVAEKLSELLGQKVIFASDCIGEEAQRTVSNAPEGSIILFENLRFYPEEEKDDETFAQQIVSAAGADIFVQDGFGVVHRAHASTSAITRLLPSYFGLLLEKEYTTITQAVQSPRRPLLAIIGGAKISDKIGLIENLIKSADQIIIGGAMANTFLAARGNPIGKSIFDADEIPEANRVRDLVTKKVGPNFADNFLVLPSDVAVAQSIDPAQQRREKPINEVTDDDIILDIGEQTIVRAEHAVARANTVVWNGTLGMTELPEFVRGSARTALAIATKPGITSVIGGGDTASFVLSWDAAHGKSFTHVSTGGGASLTLMAGEDLPGISAIMSQDTEN